MAYIFIRICNSKTFTPLHSTEFLGECLQPTEQTLMKTLAGPGKSLGWVSGGETNFFFFFCFLMSLKQLNGLQYYKKTYSWFKKVSQFKTYLFFLANNPAHGWILYYVEKNLTPICLCSWLTGIIEKWISLQYYNGMKVYFYKARKFSNSEIHEVFSKLHLLAEQG